MTEIKNLKGIVLFSFDESEMSLSEAISQQKYLKNALLNGANLNGASLKGANLEYADLKGASLKGADLKGASLEGADLKGAYLDSASLKGANLEYADLKGASLRGANLSSASLDGADLNAANIEFSKIDEMPFTPMACPSEGSFIAWKKIKTGHHCLVKLEIPEDAKRSSATSRKCRCSKAKVLEIIDIVTNEKINQVVNYNYTTCVYKVGEMVYPDSFDENRWKECSNGIHFFINKEEALEY